MEPKHSRERRERERRLAKARLVREVMRKRAERAALAGGPTQLALRMD